MLVYHDIVYGYTELDVEKLETKPCRLTQEFQQNLESVGRRQIVDQHSDHAIYRKFNNLLGLL